MALTLPPAASFADVPATPTISVAPARITPADSGGCYYVGPCHDVRGHTDPGVKVTVEVSDAFGKVASSFVYSLERDDPGARMAAGDYTLSPNVTGLGTHDTTESVLSYRAFAENAAGVRSALSAPFLVTKVAATPFDANAPTLTVSGSIPSQICGTGWCAGGGCTVTSIEGALPGKSGKGCTGRYKMTGSAEDNNSTAYGLASEIADVILTVKDSAGVTVTVVHGIGTRRGMQGYWTTDILVSDYAVGKSYTWTLFAIDAAGNQSATRSGSFTRLPL